MTNLSIIIPCYNKEKYIEECVESIFRQTLIPDEIIIVDDCSTDKSRSKILELAKKYNRIKPIFQENNGGVSEARNRGIREAKSKYITLLDSDDILYNPQKLENEMRLILENGYQTLAYSLTHVMGPNGEEQIQQPWHRHNMVLGENTIVGLLSGKFLNQYIPRDYCIEKNLLLSFGGFDPQMSYYEDFELLVKMSKNIRFVCTFSEGTGYRQLQAGLSNQGYAKHKETMSIIRNRYWGTLSLKEKMLYYVDLAENKMIRGYHKIKLLWRKIYA